MIAGWAWERLGGAHAFALGSLCALFGLVLVARWISGDDVGCPWVPGRGFDGDEDEFTYLGTASDLLTIKEPK